jgi:hypothetical protein
VAGLEIHSKDPLKGGLGLDVAAIVAARSRRAVHGANLSVVAAIVGSLSEISSLPDLYSLRCNREEEEQEEEEEEEEAGRIDGGGGSSSEAAMV